MPSFGDGPKYWDARYLKNVEPYDWLLSYKDIKSILATSLEGNRAARILNVGCGNSLLAEEMYDDGYHHIVNIDNAAVVVKQMSERNEALRPELQWLVMDAFSMDFESNFFDVVMDKSTLDAFTCGKNSSERVDTFLKEVSRVMKDSGAYLCITFGTPDTRVGYFQKPHLSLNVEAYKVPVPYEVDDKSCQFVYICRKTKQKLPSFAEGTPGDFRHRGMVDTYSCRRGFGFIKPSDNAKETVFVHWAEILTMDSWPALEAGMEVEYELGMDDTGRLVARQVTFLEGVPVSVASAMRELSTCTISGVVKHWSSKGFGFIRIDAPIDWPTFLDAGSDVYVSRQDVSSLMTLVPGERVGFKVYKAADEKHPVAATQVCKIGIDRGRCSMSWVKNGKTDMMPALQKQLGIKRQKLQW